MAGPICRLSAELVLDVRATLAEGPVWDDRNGVLLWVDILPGLLHRYSPASGEDEAIALGQPVGSVSPRRMGGLVVALRDGFGILADGHLQMVAPVEADLPDNRMNDGKCDPAGRYLAGTMHLDELLGRGALYRLNSDLSVDRLITGVTISNGLAWSIDGRLMYYIDSPTQRVDAFDYDTESGELSNRRPFVHISPDIGAPDGMTLDSEGCLWVALFDGGAVHRFTPDGALETVVELPTRQITSCAFGGDRLDVLYITTARIGRSADPLDPVAGGLFACEPGVTGLPTHYFNG